MAPNKNSIPKDFNPSLFHPNYLTRKRLLTGIQKYCGELNGKLLDFGCGAKPYQSLFHVNEYIGVDYEGQGHSHVSEQIDFFYDGKKIPFPDNYFDSIFSSEVFEHIFNLHDILPELIRVLKPGGKILITCPFAICEHEVPNDFARYTSYGIKFLLESHGFRVLAADKTGNAVETIWQLRVMNWHQHVTPLVRKIPIVRSAFRVLIYFSFNVLALLWSKILPNKQDLFLNNIVLAEKAVSN